MNRPDGWPSHWEGKVWTVDDASLREEELLNAYSALKDENDVDGFLAALGAKNRTDRRCDRAFALLKRAGLIAYDKESRSWEAV
jgi:hypothetical protein